MNKHISTVYRIEGIIIAFGSLCDTLLIYLFGLKDYLRYGILVFIVLLYIVFNDIYVFCYLLSDNE